MLQKKKEGMTKPTVVTRKPPATKTITKKNSFKQPKAPREKAPESPQHDDENDEFVTEVMKEKTHGKTSKNKSVPQTSAKKRSYQLSDKDVTADSYVYVPKGKEKKAAKKTVKTVPAKKAKKNESIGKENDSLSKNRGKRTKTKKTRDWIV